MPHDPRVNGFDAQATEHFTAPGKFPIDPQHTRALVGLEGGKPKMITYWSDVCHIRAYTPGLRVLPKRFGPGTARVGRYSISPNNYTARQVAVDGIDTVQLADAARKTELELAPGIGNMAYKWNVGGRNYLYFPYAGV